MDKEHLIKIASSLLKNSKENYISKQIAISKKSVGMKIFDEPIWGFGDPEDEYFKVLKKSSVIGEHILLPKDLLLQAKTVISFFLPFTKTVRESNSMENVWPSEEWLHGRIEGQAFLSKFSTLLQTELIREGYTSIVPSLSENFWSKAKYNNNSPHPKASFTSNWSERHTAFVCGLGTFGLSKGLITEKGMAGRFGSIITELYLKPDMRKYKDIYEYCSMCGECVKNCPVNAISIENGKNHNTCSKFIDKTLDKYNPRYGCGKCQVSTPCEYQIPV